MINPNHLRYALALEQHRHFLNAARALGISQPALSRAIQSLEKSLGLTIFDRETHGVTPTESGAQLLQSARHLLVEFEDFERESELLRDIESHVLRISLGPYAAALSGHHAVAELLRTVPSLRCRARSDPWYRTAEVLLTREADLGITELSGAILADERLATEPVSRNRAVFFCRPDHPLLAAPIHSVEALLAYPWVGTRLPERVASVLGTEPCRAGQTDPVTQEFVPTVEVDLVDQIGPLVTCSDGLGIGLLSMIEREIEEGLLRPLSFQPEWFRTNYGFVHLKRRTLSPTTVKYMELVRAIEHEITKKEADLRRRFACPVDLEAPAIDEPAMGSGEEASMARA